MVLMGTIFPANPMIYDHKNMDAAPAHRKLLERVLEVQDNTIVILFNGNTVAMPWAGRVKAILQMGYAGEAPERRWRICCSEPPAPAGNWPPPFLNP